MAKGVLAVCGAHAPSAAAAEERRAVFYRLGPLAVLGDTPNYLMVGAGVFDAFSDEGEEGEIEGERSAAANVELRLGEKVYFLGPALGLTANTDGGIFGYGGVYTDLALGDLIVTPLVGIGGYR